MKIVWIIALMFLGGISMVQAVPNLTSEVIFFVNWEDTTPVDVSGQGRDWIVDQVVENFTANFSQGFIGPGNNASGLAWSETDPSYYFSSLNHGTMCFWLFPYTNTTNTLYSDTGTNQYGYDIAAPSSTFDLTLVNGSEIYAFNITSYFTPSASWTHTCLVADKEQGTIQVYRNGVLNTTFSSVVTSTSDATVVGMILGDVSDLNYFFDEYGLWNRSFNATEVQYLFNVQLFDGVTWPFDNSTNPPIPHGNGPLQVSEACANAGSEGLMTLGIGLGILVAFVGGILGIAKYATGYKSTSSRQRSETTASIYTIITVLLALAVGYSFIVGC